MSHTVDYEIVKRAVLKAMNDMGIQMHDEREDIVQCVYMSVKDKPNKKIKHAVVDYMRTRFGRRGHKIMPETYRDQSTKGVITSPEEVVYMKELASQLEGTWRLIFVLKFTWEFTLEEIAYALGLTEGRVSQIYIDMMKWIQKKFL